MIVVHQKKAVPISIAVRAEKLIIISGVIWASNVFCASASLFPLSNALRDGIVRMCPLLLLLRGSRDGLCILKAPMSWLINKDTTKTSADPILSSIFLTWPFRSLRSYVVIDASSLFVGMMITILVTNSKFSIR